MVSFSDPNFWTPCPSGGGMQEGNLCGPKHHMLFSVVLQSVSFLSLSVSQFSEVLHYISLHHAYLGIYCPRENKVFIRWCSSIYDLLHCIFSLSHSLCGKCLSLVSEPKFKFHIAYKVFPNTISNGLSLSYFLFTWCQSPLFQKLTQPDIPCFRIMPQEIRLEK